MSHTIYKFVVGLFLLVVLADASAGEGLEKLRKYSAKLKSMQASFTQTVFDDQMRQIEISRGSFALQRPGKFRWNYEEPYEQQIVSDGEKLWLFDPDLEQVTVKPIAEALGAAPIALLTGQADIEKEFDIIELGLIAGRQFLQLELKVKDTDYGAMLLAFGESDLETMELKDKLGQVTRIEFSKVNLNTDISAKTFEFEVPDGTDVLGLQ